MGVDQWRRPVTSGSFPLRGGGGGAFIAASLSLLPLEAGSCPDGDAVATVVAGCGLGSCIRDCCMEGDCCVGCDSCGAGGNTGADTAVLCREDVAEVTDGVGAGVACASTTGAGVRCPGRLPCI